MHRKLNLKQRIGLCFAAFFAALAAQIVLSFYQSNTVLRQLDEQMQQAVAELPQVNSNGHVCVTGLNPYGVCGSAQCCGQPYACCMACPEPCNIRCGYLPKPQPAPVWHPYPDERPEEGQTVLTLSHNNYNRGNYAAYVSRAGGWYLPEFPDDGLMTVDVRWWSAELPPEEGSK